MTAKREKPYLGHAIRDSKIIYSSATQILSFDDRHEGCPRKWYNHSVKGKKLKRTDAFVQGASAAECMEAWLTRAEQVLTPILHPAAKFFPVPKNPLTGEFDLVCEEPLGDMARAIALRNQVLRSQPSPDLIAVVKEIERYAGVVALGIPLDGQADCMHVRQTYQDKDGVERQEVSGTRVVCILDLKTISRINDHVTPTKIEIGYAQTDAQVVVDPQLLIYGRRFLSKFPDMTHARLAKVFCQKKNGKLAEIRGGLVSRQQVEDAFGELESRVIFEMIMTAGAQNVADVRPAVGSSCEAYNFVAPCGAKGCGAEGVFPGEVMTPGGKIVCPTCGGKGRYGKGCGYRNTPNCPLPVQVSFIATSLDSKQSTTGDLMSLFDADSSTSPAPSSPPTPKPPALSDEDYDAEVEEEVAAVEAKLGMTPTAPTPPVAPSAPVPPTPPVVAAPSAPNALGPKIQVATCVIGEEYMVDAEDGHSPYRMRFCEVSAGIFKFSDRMGGRVNLGVADKVWRLGEAAPPAPPVPPPLKQPCGAPGCGVGCQPGMIVSADNGGVPTERACPACAGRGAVSAADMAVRPPDAPTPRWVDEQKPLSDAAMAEIHDPKLRELAEEHRRVADEEKAKTEAAAAAANPAAATRGGNCAGSGVVVIFAEQPSVVGGKVVCSICGAEKSIPKEIRKARPMPVSMEFPGHRRPKAKGEAAVETGASTGAAQTPPAETAVAAPTPPVPPAVTAPVPPVMSMLPTPSVPPVTVATLPVPPPLPMPPAVTALVPPTPPAPPVEAAPVPPMPGLMHLFPGVVVLSKEEVDIVSSLFKMWVGAIPRVALAPATIELFKRLRLVD